MTAETERAYRRWQKAANAEPPKRQEHITSATRRWARIAGLKRRYEALLARDKAAGKLA